MIRATASAEKDGAWEAYLPREGEYSVQHYVIGMQRYAGTSTISVEKGRTPQDLVIQADPDAK